MGMMMNYISYTIILGFFSIIGSESLASYEYKLNKEIVLLDNSELKLILDSEEDMNYFKEALYDELRQELVFSTNRKSIKINIYDESDSKIYTLPLDSSEIKIGKSLFVSGRYKLEFEAKNELHTYSSTLIVH